LGVSYIFDPHHAVAKWPKYAIVYGAGRNFPQVYEKLVWLHDLLDRRAKEQAGKREGDCTFPPVALIADEWGSILSNVKVERGQTSPSDLVMDLLKEGRKFKIGFLAGANDLAHKAALGLLPPEKAAVAGKIILNQRIDAFLTAFFLVVLWTVILDMLRVTLRVRRGQSVRAGAEVPYQRTRLAEASRG